MSMVIADNLHLSFGSQAIFSGAGFHIDERDRIGLIGPNGTGKTTLLRILAGKQGVDQGSLGIQREIRVGYLPQDIMEVPSAPLLESVLQAVPGKEDLAGEIASCERRLDASDDPAEQMELATRLAELHEKANHQEMFFAEHEAERILAGLGFGASDFGRPLDEFSGGWKMRAALAGILFRQPDLLLLDEPTNHLDALSVHWLESFLSGFNNAMVLISHDREFLDRQARRILSLEPEGLRSYPGNYSRYRRLRREEERVLDNQARNVERKRKELERFIDRYRAQKPKARQAQSRIKMLRKVEEVQRLEKPKEIRKFTFPPVERTARNVCTVDRIAKSFGDLHLYRDLSLTVQRGERIAIIGVNGAGKTTLLRIMAGALKPDSGVVRLGGNVLLGYYAQHQTESLRPDATILEEVWSVVPDMGQSFVRGVLGAFLFPADDVDKKIAVLSGGEKARVSLAKLLVKPYNLLLMDEPSNHLDLHSSEALAEALEQYEGTLVLVSHNQALVNRLANKVWNIEDGRVDEYPGNLADYYFHLDRIGEEAKAVEEAQAEVSEDTARPVGSEKEFYQQRKKQRRQADARRREYKRKVEAADRKIRDLEARIAELETRQSELSAALADPEVYKAGQGVGERLSEYDRNRRKLEELMGRWEAVHKELERLQNDPPADPGESSPGP